MVFIWCNVHIQLSQHHHSKTRQKEGSQNPVRPATDHVFISNHRLFHAAPNQPGTKNLAKKDPLLFYYGIFPTHSWARPEQSRTTDIWASWGGNSEQRHLLNVLCTTEGTSFVQNKPGANWSAVGWGGWDRDLLCWSKSPFTSMLMTQR